MTRLKAFVAAATMAVFATASVPALSQEGAMQMKGMEGKDMKDMPCCEELAHGVGVVNSIDAEARKVNLTHEPVPAIGWGEMTMSFEAGRMVDLAKFKKGDRVQFALKQGRDKTYRIMMMCETASEEVVEKLCMNGKEQSQ